MNLSMSDNGLEFLIKKEGLKLKVYLDSAGLPTIGIGHLITKENKSTGKIYGILYKGGITKEQALFIKKQDLNKFEYYVNRFLEVEVTQNEFDALVSLCFNIGQGAFKSSTLLKLLNKDENTSEEIANEFLKWNKAGGKVIKGLTIRRKEEREIFLNNKYPD